MLGLNDHEGYTGDQTPVYDAFFAGGFSSLRGFEFRGAGPHANSVLVDGGFEVLAGNEYLFPITADDSLRGVVFLDTGPGPTGCQWMRRATTKGTTSGWHCQWRRGAVLSSSLHSRCPRLSSG